MASFLEHTIHFRDLCARHQTHHYKLPKESEGASRHPLSHALKAACLSTIGCNRLAVSKHRTQRRLSGIDRRAPAARDALPPRPLVWRFLPMGPVPKTLPSRDSLFPGVAATHKWFSQSQVLGKLHPSTEVTLPYAGITGRATDHGLLRHLTISYNPTGSTNTLLNDLRM